MDNTLYKSYLKKMFITLKSSMREKEKYDVDILGRNFIVFPQVFSPKYFFDTELYAKNLPIENGESFLEIGCGVGVISIFAVLNGAARVVAVDINPAATENTIENVKRFGLEDKIKVYNGNLFDPLPDQDTFDTIFWNTPFGFIENKELSIMEKSVFDSNYESHKQFIYGAAAHLNTGGRLLIGFSSTLGNKEKLNQQLIGAGYNYQLLKEMIYQGKGETVKFEIFEARLK
ncbi:MAG: tRNA (adenine(22)-N(1))-methyltransferase TrmK [Spirochaetales bacterium]|nr:tRNA (adenine(22)-N(1))-methyltransferase TrmK [Spirochaetales bacterium]